VRRGVPWTAEQKRAEYARLRAKLERLLGARCTACGSSDEWAVDHEGGTRVYSARRMNSIARLRLYLEEVGKGGVRRLCSSCNGSDGDKRRWYEETNVDDTM
jgi:hypothetical protein